ncbi:MAG TPA: polysaccharide deacetylase family protein, partial [Rhabdaerophilum sp.]|nr:polysaccharide deacetylase family protein [Rhabdaerophilum sp.]
SAAALVLSFGPTSGQAPGPRPGVPPAASGCGSPGALGVTRVVDIDTGTGPRFGHQQYHDHDFLADGEVVLTFDDGPNRTYTQSILEALDSHCTKATFFMVGRMALSDPAMVKSVARRGHTIANHTFSHKKQAGLSPAEARAEIELGFSAIQKALGAPIAPFFRFPYLSDPKSSIAYVQSRHSAIFSIEVDAYDYRTPSAVQVVQNVMNQLRAKRKGIILFHDIQPSTAGAMRMLLAELKTRGYRVVHVRPKAGYQTLAEFDVRVGAEHRHRENVAAANPMVKRAVTWPVAAPPLPPVAVQPLPPPPAEAPPRPKRVTEDPDWRRGIFGGN